MSTKGKKIWKHRGTTIKGGDTFIKYGGPTDLVVAIMGPPGVGKSTFIDALLGEGTTNEWKLRTPSHVQYFIRPLPLDPTRRLFVVEMPGFDNPYVDDAEILRRISVWLATSYVNDMKLAGIIYLHDISPKRMTVNARLNLEMLRKLCGDDALPSVVLVVTQWSEVEIGVGEDRLQALKTNFWSDMIEHGSYIFKFDNTNASAWSMVNYLLEKWDYDALQLQKELVDLQKIIPDTSAGKELRYMLEQRLKIQWDDATDEQLQITSTAIQKLKVPIPLRLKLLFGIDSFHEGTTTTVIKHKKRVTRTVEVNTNIQRNTVTRPRDTTTSASKVNTSRTEEANTNVKGNDVSRPNDTTTYASEINRVSVPKEDTVALSSVEEKDNSRSTRFAGEVPSKADLTPGRGGSSSALDIATVNPIVDGRDGAAVSCDDVPNDSTITTAPGVTQVDLRQSPDYCTNAPVDSIISSIAKLNSAAQRSTARFTKTASTITPSEQPEESFDNGGTTADNQTATPVTAGVTTAAGATQVDVPRSCSASFDNENSTAKVNSAAQGITALVIERRCSVESLVIEAARVKSTLQKEGCDSGSTTDIQPATQEDVLQESHRVISTSVTETETTSVTGAQIFGNARDFGISDTVMIDGAKSTVNYTHTENRTTNDTHIHFHLRKPLGPKDRKFISKCIQRSKGDAELDNDRVHIHRQKVYVVGSSKNKSRRAKHAR